MLYHVLDPTHVSSSHSRVAFPFLWAAHSLLFPGGNPHHSSSRPLGRVLHDGESHGRHGPRCQRNNRRGRPLGLFCIRYWPVGGSRARSYRTSKATEEGASLLARTIMLSMLEPRCGKRRKCSNEALAPWFLVLYCMLFRLPHGSYLDSEANAISVIGRSARWTKPVG